VLLAEQAININLWMGKTHPFFCEKFVVVIPIISSDRP
jgi:hypothetical protein